MRSLTLVLLTYLFLNGFAGAQTLDESSTSRGDKLLADYFRRRTEAIEVNCLANIGSAEDWRREQGRRRIQLHKMLGLRVLQESFPLKATVTGIAEHEAIVVEKIHFQSRPGLYVTGNLYRPKHVEGRLPAILYLCGHGAVKKNGVSYGNKVHYQHHGAWFAENGYVCLAIDSLQLGEIEGIHHGTHRFGMWWWINRGYTPAGVEALNCMRALDYLETRSDVDPAKLGVTGRSGGGAYSWWIAALDERIACAVPVAGITDLRNYVIDGAIEGHCDCMFIHNSEQWDYADVAALVAPRPLMIANTDRDPIFPLDGVVRIHAKTKKVYDLLGAKEKLALTITPGGHDDTQDLHTATFRWFNKHLKGNDGPITRLAEPRFTPEQLRVFEELPSDQINTKIQETFVAAADEPKVPKNADEWKEMRERWRDGLPRKALRSMLHSPSEQFDEIELNFRATATADSERLDRLGLTPLDHGELDLFLVRTSADDLSKPRVTLNVVNEEEWKSFSDRYVKSHAAAFASDSKIDPKLVSPEFKGNVIAYFAPTGVGPTAFDRSEKKQIQNRRRFQQLGESLESRQACDIAAAIAALRHKCGRAIPVTLRASGAMAGTSLYAGTLAGIEAFELTSLPRTHRDGPILPGISRTTEFPLTVAAAIENSRVTLIRSGTKSDWHYPLAVAKSLGWPDDRLQIVEESNGK